MLGIIQGLTEFLPVSSSGHLQIFSALFGLEGEENLTFAVAVHAATVCSTIVILWKEVSVLFKGFFVFKYNDEMAYVLKIFLSMIPVAIVGFCFKDYVETLFGSGLTVVGCMLLVTACAVLPGLSRSGSTIATGILLGNKKEAVAKFSFLMVLIPILGEALLDLMKGGFSAEASGISTMSLLVGFMAAFVSGCIACRWMINIVKKGKLIWFALYCAIVGILTIVLG